MKTAYFLDRSQWPSGPWDREPDAAEWIDEETGLLLLAVRSPFGSWYGYVILGKDHPYFGKTIHELDELDVHGGVTVARRNEGAEGWLIGFDCGHSGDCIPGFASDVASTYVTYKTLGFVQRQCALLAHQLARVG